MSRMSELVMRLSIALSAATLGLATAGSAAAPAEPHAEDPCPLSSILVPECENGVHWGIYTLRGETPSAAVTQWEQRLDRPFDVVLRYHDFSNRPGPGEFPDKFERELGESRLLFMTWESRLYREDRDLRWADIAAGLHDDVILAAGNRIADYGRPLFLSFDAEMDRLLDIKGSPEEYVAAARRVRVLFDGVGATNVVWVWTVTGYLGEGGDEIIERAYPGDKFVDWVGYDPYNFYRCQEDNPRDWKSFDQTVGRFYDWAVAKGLDRKPFFIPEYGTQFDPDDHDRSRAFYRDIPGVLEVRRNIKALIRWDSDFGCNLRLDNGPGMVDAFAATGKHLEKIRAGDG